MFIKQVHAKMSAFDGGIASLSEKNIAEDLPILDFMDPEQDIVFSMSQYPGDERTVDVHVRRLREKIEEDAGNPTYVHTRWGVGYFFTQNGN